MARDRRLATAGPGQGRRRMPAPEPRPAALLGLVLCGILCHGVPLAENSTEPTLSIPVGTEAQQLPLAHPLDDFLPGTTQEPAPPAALAFLNVPQHTRTQLGRSVLLVCRTAEPVVECQWSWQPLPPTHLPLPNIEDSASQAAAAKDTLLNGFGVTTSNPGSLSLPIRSFPAFGNLSNDCSVRFSSTRHEQTGYWSCAARRANEDNFTSTPPARLSIVYANTATPIIFVEQERSLETPAGSGVRLHCRTTSPVRECQWSWRQLNQSQPWDAEMRRFSASGNDSSICDLGLSSARAEHEGYWTCGARVVSTSPFVQGSSIKLLISEVEFVKWLPGIQITAGETVFLRCLVNKPVNQCEWSWRPSNSSMNSTVVKKFSPNAETDRDCSVRFKNILYEEEGLWTCGVRLTLDGILHEAPSTIVTLLPSGKVNFTETPENTSTALGSEATLRCSTNGRVDLCVWAWRPLNGSPDAEASTQREFPSHGDLRRNCSLTLTNVSLDEQGHWTCQVHLTGQGAILTASSVKLTVFEKEDVTFSELSKDIQISLGGIVSLRCVTTARVEQCRWSLTPEATANTTVVVKLFPPAGPDGRDCSVKLSHALQEQEGLWTCGARLHARQNYTNASPARLSLIEPEPIIVTVWGLPHQKLNLACKRRLRFSKTQCFWSHGSKIRLSNVNNGTKKIKYLIYMNHTTGVCSLQFAPDNNDFVDWICEFVINNPNRQMQVGRAFILLLNNSPDQQLGWLVGAITSTVLFLLIIAVVVVVCKARLCVRKVPTFLETLPPSERLNSIDNTIDIVDERCVQRLGKIELSYANPNFLIEPESISSVLSNRSPQVYDRVNRHPDTMIENYDQAKRI